MKFSILTFNLDMSKGIPKLLRVVQEYKPDIVSLQEFDTSADSRKIIEDLGYTFAEGSYSFRFFFTRYSVATFYKKEKFRLVSGTRLSLPIGLIEILLFFKGGRRSVASTLFEADKKKFWIHNVHLTPYTTNNLRTKQIHTTLKSVQSEKRPTIVLGDFNYPYGRKKFENIFKKYNFHEATDTIFHTFRSTFRFLPFKFKLDYVLYHGIKHISTIQIDKITTDHTPIITEFEM